MSNSMPWLKLPSNKYQQSRVALCSRDTRLDYYELYQLAAQCNTDGLFFEDGHQLTHDEIAFKLRRTPKELKLSLKELEERKLIHINGKGPQIVDFKTEQLKWNELKEQRRERDKRYREKRRDADTPPTDGVSPTDASSTLLEREESQSQIKNILSLLSEHRETLETKHPEWIPEAIKIAKANGKQGDKYIAGILNNWILEGRNPKKGTRKNGNTQPGATKRPEQPKPTQANYSAADRAAAERALAKRAKAHV